MKTIRVKSLPLKLVISDIAEQLSGSLEESCGEYSVNIPKAWGKGTIRGINFEGGLGIIQYECEFLDDLEIQFIVNNVHPLKFLYCLEGNLLHSFETENSWHKLDQYQCKIVGSQKHNGHILKFHANTKTSIRSLEIDRKHFQTKMDCEVKSLSTDLKELFLDDIANRKFYYIGYYSLKIADLFRQIKEFEHIDFIKRIFLEGKAYQILTYQILQYHDDLQDEGERSVLRRSEIILIEKAAKLISDEISELDNIDALARRVGLNVNKLQEGFKYSYQNTVNGYIQKIRLEMSKELLKYSDLSISEIVLRVGLSSKSYFSKVFKERYNISPSEYRRNRKKSNS